MKEWSTAGINAPARNPSLLRKVTVLWMIAATIIVLLTGCTLSIPTDPGGSLDTISGNELRIGIAPETGFSTATDPPEGPLPDLATDFARSLHARTSWEIASEETLVHMLESGEIDLVLGNFTAGTAWAGDVGVSRPFLISVEGTKREIVAFLPAGENAFLAKFETYLDETGKTS